MPNPTYSLYVHAGAPVFNWRSTLKLWAKAARIAESLSMRAFACGEGHDAVCSFWATSREPAPAFKTRKCTTASLTATLRRRARFERRGEVTPPRNVQKLCLPSPPVSCIRTKEQNARLASSHTCVERYLRGGKRAGAVGSRYCACGKGTPSEEDLPAAGGRRG